MTNQEKYYPGNSDLWGLSLTIQNTIGMRGPCSDDDHDDYCILPGSCRDCIYEWLEREAK